MGCKHPKIEDDGEVPNKDHRLNSISDEEEHAGDVHFGSNDVRTRSNTPQMHHVPTHSTVIMTKTPQIHHIPTDSTLVSKAHISMDLKLSNIDKIEELNEISFDSKSHEIIPKTTAVPTTSSNVRSISKQHNVSMRIVLSDLDNKTTSTSNPNTNSNSNTSSTSPNLKMVEENVTSPLEYSNLTDLKLKYTHATTMPRDSVKSQTFHSHTTSSFDPDADFGNNNLSQSPSHLNINHGFGPSVQINDVAAIESVEIEDGDESLSDALEVEPLPSHYLTQSGSVESLDPDFVLEAAYFDNRSAPTSNFNHSTQWTMPGVSIDHTQSTEMLKSIQLFTADSKANSVQYENIFGNVNSSIQYFNNSANSVHYDNNSASIASSMSGDQFVVWQMHGRKLQKMTHDALIKWLQQSGFSEDLIMNFRQKKIDGRKLWSNIRNASMFLYNVGVVRPTLRDAIVQNIYLELLPKTPGFDERHMSDFKRFQLISQGPISTVYKAVIQNIEKLKLRESTVIIKGYHFAADEVRVGKIIQILVHMVTNIQRDSARFVKIHGFIRNMMENNDNPKNAVNNRPMFGIVMEYCNNGSIGEMFKKGKNARYHLEYNIMDKIGFLTEIAMAMNELHQKRMFHRNLKASNVLLSNNDDIKLTDYCLDVTQLTDFSRFVDAKERSIRWMSPELIQTQNYTKECDVYSFGITCYEILSGNKPYHQYNVSDLLRRIIQENLRPDIDDLANLPEELLVLMSNCWNVDVEKRPAFDEIVSRLDAIHDKLRRTCVTFDDIYAKARTSMMNPKLLSFQSSPLLTMGNSGDSLEYDAVEVLDYEENDNYDQKFENVLRPFNQPRHAKDDSALELDKIKIFEPKRRKLHAKKKRPRRPLPKAPPVTKQLPAMRSSIKIINNKEVHCPDKPLPINPLFTTHKQ